MLGTIAELPLTLEELTLTQPVEPAIQRDDGDASDIDVEEVGRTKAGPSTHKSATTNAGVTSAGLPPARLGQTVSGARISPDFTIYTLTLITNNEATGGETNAETSPHTAANSVGGSTDVNMPKQASGTSYFLSSCPLLSSF